MRVLWALGVYAGIASGLEPLEPGSAAGAYPENAHVRDVGLKGDASARTLACQGSVWLNGAQWLQGGVGRVHISGSWHGPTAWVPRSLVHSLGAHLSPNPVPSHQRKWFDGTVAAWEGADWLGRFEATQCGWTVAGVDVDTTVTTYPAHNATIFTTTFVSAASGTNASAPPTTWADDNPPTADDVGPFAEFPAFDLGAGRLGNLSWMTWRGGLQFHDTSKGTVQVLAQPHPNSRHSFLLFVEKMTVPEPAAGGCSLSGWQRHRLAIRK